MGNTIGHDEAAEVDAMTVRHDRRLTPVEQAIYNAAYAKGRQDYAAELRRSQR